jgi:hypothetical protein
LFTAVFMALAISSTVRAIAVERIRSTVPVAVGVGARQESPVNVIGCGCADSVADARASGVAHAVMALAMAVMFLPLASPVPSAVWTGVFVLMGAWFAAGLLRVKPSGESVVMPWDSVAVHHLLGSIAMVYLSVTQWNGGSGNSGGGMAGMDMSVGSVGFLGSIVTTALLLYFVVDTGLSGIRLRKSSGARLAGICRVLMSLGMAAMMFAML